MFAELARRIDPEGAKGLGLEDAPAIRRDIALAVPFYKGIETLQAAGQAIQWGGPRLCEGGRSGLADGRSRFHAVQPTEMTIPEGHFHLSTRRGKQFNSMIQAERDPLTGGMRDDVFMAPADAGRLGLSDGDAIVLRSDVGEFRGRCRTAPMKERNLQVFWPEANTLIRRDVVEPQCGIPDFTAIVSVERASVAPADAVAGAGGTGAD